MTMLCERVTICITFEAYLHSQTQRIGPQSGSKMTTPGTPPSSASSSSTLASRGIQPRFSELGQSCRKLVLNHLADHLTLSLIHI